MLWRRLWLHCLVWSGLVWSGLVWIFHASDYLFSSRAASWIGPPDYALLEETLARGLGLWLLPKLGLILLLLVV